MMVKVSSTYGNQSEGHDYRISKGLKSCIYQFYSCVNLKIIFQNTCHIKSFFPCKDHLNRSQRSKVIYKACCWDRNDFYIGETKRPFHDSKTEHFKSLTENDHPSAIADHITATGHNIKWDHFEILASGKTDSSLQWDKRNIVYSRPLLSQRQHASAVKSWCFLSCCLLYSLLLRIFKFLISSPDPL